MTTGSLKLSKVARQRMRTSPRSAGATEQSADSTEATTARRITDLLRRILSYLLLALAIAFTTITIVIPKIGGAVPVTILSDSMAPEMPVGSLAIIVPTSPLSAIETKTLSAEKIRAAADYTQLAIGDIVAYQPDPQDATLVIHRIVGIAALADGTLSFTTKGDNNRVPDRDKVSDFQIRGVVWYHLPPPLGTLNTLINHDPTHHLVSVLVVAGAGYVWAIVLFWRAFRRQQPDEHTPPSASGDPESNTPGPSGSERLGTTADSRGSGNIGSSSSTPSMAPEEFRTSGADSHGEPSSPVERVVPRELVGSAL